MSGIGDIRVSRLYDHEPLAGGSAFLVERLWPRGVRREELETVVWLKDVAPSTALRKWFNHETEKWAAFRRCYTGELDANPQGWQPLAEAAARAEDVTLLYSSRDRDHNSAVVLRDYLQAQLRNG